MNLRHTRSAVGSRKDAKILNYSPQMDVDFPQMGFWWG